LRLRLPIGGLVEATRSAMEGSVCSDALELVGLEAIGLAEEAPPSSVSSSTDFFCLMAEASGVGTSFSPLGKGPEFATQVESSAISIKESEKGSDAYRGRRVFTVVRCGHSSRSRIEQILIKQTCHKPIYFGLSQNYMKQRSSQVRMINHQQ
jgi:hypothetical protein